MSIKEYEKRFPDGAKVRNLGTGQTARRKARWLFQQFEVATDQAGNNLFGWVIDEAPKEVKEHKAPEKKVEAKAPEGKTSKDFSAKDMDDIREYAEGLDAEGREEFFAVEDRKTVLALKAELEGGEA